MCNVIQLTTSMHENDTTAVYISGILQFPTIRLQSLCNTMIL